MSTRAGRVFRDNWLVIALTALVVVLNPFGYRTALDRQGERLFAWYAGLRHGEGSRAETLVVVLQDADLDRLGKPWPLPYGTHAEILRKIRDQKDPATNEPRNPRALMIDFLFIDKARNDPSLGELIGELEEYRRNRIPVFLAAPLVPDPEAAVLPRLQAGRVTPDPQKPGRLVEDRLTRLVPVPRSVDEEGDNLYRFFLCAATDPRRKEECQTWRRTAAVEMYDQLCTFAACGGTRLPIDASLEGKDLTLVWGRKPPADWTVEATGCRRERFGERLGRGLGALSLIEFLHLDCPSTSTLSVGQLMDPTRSFAAQVHGKVIFYGGGLQGTLDIVRPPLHTPLAGVYAHATAFENLRAYGKHYKREPASPLRVPLSSITVVQFLLLYVGSVLRERLRNRGRRGWPTAFLASLALYEGLALLWVAFVAVVEFELFDVVPGHWLEVFLELVVGTHAATIVAEFVETVHTKHEAHGV